MNNIKRLAIPITLIICAIILIIIGSALRNNEPLVLQGTVCCTTYKAASKIAGRIDSLWVKQGDRVEFGAPLYALSTPELDIKLTQANAAKNAAKAIDEQTIAGARKQQIDAAHSLWLKAKTGSDFALKSYQRIARLSQSGVVTAQQLDEARANYEAMQATEQAAFSQYSLALAGATKEQKAAAAANVDMAQSTINEVEQYIADSRVYAPISGEVSTIAYNRGEIVSAGFPVVTILDLSDIWVEFNIKETLLPLIDRTTALTAYIPAIDATTQLEIEYISPQAEFATWNATRAKGGFDVRTFKVKMRPTDKSIGLRQGISALIRIKDIKQ